MEITRKEHENTIILILVGRLNTTTAPKLEEAVMPELKSGKNVMLDFTGVSYVSSAGLRVLLVGEKTAKANSVKQTLTNVGNSIMEVFEMTGFAAILYIKQG